jgi:hypothetical protein
MIPPIPVMIAASSTGTGMPSRYVQRSAKNTTARTSAWPARVHRLGAGSENARRRRSLSVRMAMARAAPPIQRSVVAVGEMRPPRNAKSLPMGERPRELESSRASPLYARKPPRVAMNGGMRTLAIRNPCHSPTSTDTPRAAAIATMAGW